MKFFLMYLLLPALSFAQNSDWKELQGKIDSAIKVNGKVEIRRNYSVDKPLIAAAWNGKDYAFFTIQIVGNSLSGKDQHLPKITSLFKDAPLLSIQKGKGVIVKGIHFQGQYRTPGMSETAFYSSDLATFGDPSCRDKMYSPYCAVAIDPFMYKTPPDGGYPSLSGYYRGGKSVSGSTGIRIEDCRFSGFTVGAITSPNGFTLNAELTTFQNIEVNNCKIAIAGCQAQEKLNRVINLNVTGNLHTVFGFNQYGQKHPGHWVVDTVNISGRVVQLIHRSSSGYFPVYISNVKTNCLGRIGYWQTGISDRLDHSTIIICPPEKTGVFQDSHLSGAGLSITGTKIQYAGGQRPLLLKGARMTGNLGNEGGMVNGKYDHKELVVRQLFRVNPLVINNDRQAVIKGQGVKKGQVIFFMNVSNWEYLGMAEVISVEGNSVTVGFISNGIKNGGSYRVGVLK